MTICHINAPALMHGCNIFFLPLLLLPSHYPPYIVHLWIVYQSKNLTTVLWWLLCRLTMWFSQVRVLVMLKTPISSPNEQVNRLELLQNWGCSKQRDQGPIKECHIVTCTFCDTFVCGCTASSLRAFAHILGRAVLGQKKVNVETLCTNMQRKSW